MNGMNEREYCMLIIFVFFVFLNIEVKIDSKRKNGSIGKYDFLLHIKILDYQLDNIHYFIPQYNFFFVLYKIPSIVKVQQKQISKF